MKGSGVRGRGPGPWGKGERGKGGGLARRFALPRQRLNYHLKELERVGLLDLVEERRKGNCIERVVRATARSYAISPDVLGGLGHARAAVDRLSATYLISVASRAIKEVAGLVARAAAAGTRVSTLTIDTDIRFARAETRAAFADDLADAVARLASRYHAPDGTSGRTFRLLAAVYAKPTSTAATSKELSHER